MKIRKGFVTNSSSSSYVCEICHYADSTYDGGPEDVGMCECTNGHIICQEHALTVTTTEKNLSYLATMLDSFKNNDRYAAEYIQVQELIGMSDEARNEWIDENDDKWTDLLENIDVYNSNGRISEVECPICMCDFISDREMLNYVTKNFNVTLDQLKAATREIKLKERER